MPSAPFPPPTPYSGLGLIAPDLFVRPRDRNLETTLATWEKPPSDTEEEEVQRAARMVQTALSRNTWLRMNGVTVEPQGSYHNNTNVRRKADMDLRVVHPALSVLPSVGVNHIEADFHLGYVRTGGNINDTAKDLRREVELALTAHFGLGNVAPGKKAFRVGSVPGSRSDIDVVPAVSHCYVCRNLAPGLFGIPPLFEIKGIRILGTDGSVTYNYPQRHHLNGKNKRILTTGRFKKIVRCLKRLRDEMIISQQIQGKTAPSFFIECLVYCADDVDFNYTELRAARLRRILISLQRKLSDPIFLSDAREINDVKLLFAQDQPWTVAAACNFVARALAWLNGP